MTSWRGKREEMWGGGGKEGVEPGMEEEEEEEEEEVSSIRVLFLIFCFPKHVRGGEVG